MLMHPPSLFPFLAFFRSLHDNPIHSFIIIIIIICSNTTHTGRARDARTKKETYINNETNGPPTRTFLSCYSLTTKPTNEMGFTTPSPLTPHPLLLRKWTEVEPAAVAFLLRSAGDAGVCAPCRGLGITIWLLLAGCGNPSPRLYYLFNARIHMGYAPPTLIGCYY